MSAVSTSPPDQRDRTSPPRHIQVGNRLLEWAETCVYAGIAVFLAITSVALLVGAARKVPSLFGDEVTDTAVDVLDTLLLVFIVIELLYAVRITIARRELIAEPFLLVGVIASIKEIVVLSVKAAEDVGMGNTFTDQLWEIAILGLLVFVFGGTALLLRRKEREPDEGGSTPVAD